MTETVSAPNFWGCLVERVTRVSNEAELSASIDDDVT